MPKLRFEKQEVFASLLAQNIKPAEAYAQAGYSPRKASECCQRLVRDPRIIARVTELRGDPLAEQVNETVGHIHSINRIIGRLILLSVKAEAKGQFGSAIRAEELLGKHLGMWKDGDDGKIEWDGDPDKLTVKQQATLSAKLRNMVTQRGGNLIEAQAIPPTPETALPEQPYVIARTQISTSSAQDAQSPQAAIPEGCETAQDGLDRLRSTSTGRENPLDPEDFDPFA